MDYQNVFKRYEIKFMLTESQYNAVMNAMRDKTEHDKFSNSTVRNVYYDTPDYFLIRRSLDKPVYKEKLRVRSYTSADENSKVFVELKKKYKSVVYKRRTAMSLREAETALSVGKFNDNTQITNEIEYFIKVYDGLQPAVYISYEREAYKANDGSELRITFDRNILYRTNNLTLSREPSGAPVLEKGQVLMEVKTATAIPLWLVKVLSNERVYKTSFSKYGTVYTTALEKPFINTIHAVAQTSAKPITKGELIYV